MYKQIIFYSFIATTLSTLGMESPYQPRKKKNAIVRACEIIPRPFKSKKKNIGRSALALNIHEIIESLLQQAMNQDNICEIIKDIRILEKVNKKMAHHCCAPQYTNFGIITQFSQKNGLSDFNVALDNAFACVIGRMVLLKTIATQKERFFTPSDFKNTWYLKASYDGYDHFPRVTILHMAMANLNVEKTNSIIKNMIENKIAIPKNSLALLAGIKSQADPADLDRIDEKDKKAYYDIAKLLLENGAYPDSHSSTYFFTLLHKAALSGSKELAELLLQYDANPYEEYVEKINKKYMQSGKREEPWKNNAFTLEQGEPQGWLETMYRKIQSEKKQKLELANS